jgi:AcrR family transcriptional regulator
MRADARRNLALILAAAREVFLEQGIDGSVEEIARRAGVGVGTVYRRFPTKEDLVDAIIAEHFDELAQHMRSHLDADDPWEGFCGLIRQTLELFAENRGFKAVVNGRFADGVHGPVNVRELMEASGEVVRRAQDAGALRADFSPTDLPLLFRSVGAVMDASRDVNPRLWERHLSMVLDGLRAEAATPAPVPAMSVEEQFLIGRTGAPGRC